MPMQHDKAIIFKKLLVSILADIAGATIAVSSKQSNPNRTHGCNYNAG